MRYGRKLAAILALSTAAASLSGCSLFVNNETTAITIGDQEVTYGLVNLYFRVEQGSYEIYASYFGSDPVEMWEEEYTDGESYEEFTKDELLEYIEEIYLMDQHTEDFGIELTEEEEAAISEAAAEFIEDNTEEALEVVSGETKYVEEYLRILTIEAKMDEAMRAEADTDVTDDEAAQKAMDYVLFSYTTEDDDGEEVDLSDDEIEELTEQAEEFASALADGSDMETLAEEYDAEFTSDTFDADSDSLDEDLVAAADALESEGDITDLIETDDGIYIAQLTSLFDEEATEEKKEEIIEERQDEIVEEYLDEWKEDTEITVHKSVINKIKFTRKGISVIYSDDEEDTTEEDTTEEDTTEEDTAEEDTTEEDTTEEDTTEEDSTEEDTAEE